MCNILAVAQGWSGNIPHSPTAEKQGWSRNNDPSYSHSTHCIQKQWPILLTLHSLHPETMTPLTHIPLTASGNNDPSYSHSTHCIQKQWPILLTFHSLHPETMTPLTHTPLIASRNNDPSYTPLIASRNNGPSYSHSSHCIQKQCPILLTLHSLHPETMTHLTHTPLIASRNNDPSYTLPSLCAAEYGWSGNTYPSYTNIHTPLTCCSSPQEGTTSGSQRHGWCGSPPVPSGCLPSLTALHTKHPTLHFMHKHIHHQWDSNISAHQTAYNVLTAQTHPSSVGLYVQHVQQLGTPNSLQCTWCTNTSIVNGAPTCVTALHTKQPAMHFMHKHTHLLSKGLQHLHRNMNGQVSKKRGNLSSRWLFIRAAPLITSSWFSSNSQTPPSLLPPPPIPTPPPPPPYAPFYI